MTTPVPGQLESVWPVDLPTPAEFAVPFTEFVDLAQGIEEPVRAAYALGHFVGQYISAYDAHITDANEAIRRKSGNCLSATGVTAALTSYLPGWEAHPTISRTFTTSPTGVPKQETHAFCLLTAPTGELCAVDPWISSGTRKLGTGYMFTSFEQMQLEQHLITNPEGLTIDGVHRLALNEDGRIKQSSGHEAIFGSTEDIKVMHLIYSGPEGLLRYLKFTRMLHAKGSTIV